MERVANSKSIRSVLDENNKVFLNYFKLCAE